MGLYGFGGMGFLDSFLFGGGFQILFFLIFALVIGLFIATAVRGIRQWHRNNNSPRLTVDAAVVAKRTEVSHTITAVPETPTTPRPPPGITSRSRWRAGTGWNSRSVAGSTASWWRETGAA